MAKLSELPVTTYCKNCDQLGTGKSKTDKVCGNCGSDDTIGFVEYEHILDIIEEAEKKFYNDSMYSNLERLKKAYELEYNGLMKLGEEEAAVKVLSKIMDASMQQTAIKGNT